MRPCASNATEQMTRSVGSIRITHDFKIQNLPVWHCPDIWFGWVWLFLEISCTFCNSSCCLACYWGVTAKGKCSFSDKIFPIPNPFFFQILGLQTPFRHGYDTGRDIKSKVLMQQLSRRKEGHLIKRILSAVWLVFDIHWFCIFLISKNRHSGMTAGPTGCEFSSKPGPGNTSPDRGNFKCTTFLRKIISTYSSSTAQVASNRKQQVRHTMHA